MTSAKRRAYQVAGMAVRERLLYRHEEEEGVDAELEKISAALMAAGHVANGSGVDEEDYRHPGSGRLLSEARVLRNTSANREAALSAEGFEPVDHDTLGTLDRLK